MPPLTRDDISARYFEQLPFPPYPVQEEALLSWFTSEQGVLVCAPTGTGKTLIAEAALFEALHAGKRAYYTTPLIALTDQKFRELRQQAVRWGFSADDVGLVTGNRKVNPDAPVLVVVAEILFNRLLHRDEFAFDDVAAVVMDEFHNFNDPERGIVWEFSLGLLPAHVRLLLLSATVGNAYEFTSWLRREHGRTLELVESKDRKTPLSFYWIGDQLLTEQLEAMAEGPEERRRTPALVFCFNRDECWSVADELRGKSLLADGQQAAVGRELERYDLSTGAGPKLKQLLLRGVGVHHAGVLPKYRRVVEDLFQRRLLSVCVCTETLAAGVNLPARSVVIPNLLKGPPDKKRLVEASSAHQMFGRAGRPQFDKEGYVYALAHEDDVRIHRWRLKFDSIPEDTKDPGLLKARKDLKRKQPTRRSTESYWSEGQFHQLRDAQPTKLSSRGQVPWRLLAYMLEVSPEVAPLRRLVSKRLLDVKRLEAAQRSLDTMLLTLWRAGYVDLEPKPPPEALAAVGSAAGGGQPPASGSGKPAAALQGAAVPAVKTPPPAPEKAAGGFAGLLAQARSGSQDAAAGKAGAAGGKSVGDGPAPPPRYQAEFAYPTERLALLSHFRSVNPLYGVFLVNQLGIADRTERIQAMESVLELPGSVARFARVPKPDEMPPGPLAVGRLDVELLRLGLASPEQLGAGRQEDEEDRRRYEMFPEEKVWPLTLAEKLRLLFDHDFPGVHDVYTQPAWAAGELLEYGGDFQKLVTSKQIQKQEGVFFRHFLRMVLLCAEFARLAPADCDADAWRAELREIAEQLTSACRRVDPDWTDEMLEQIEEAEG